MVPSPNLSIQVAFAHWYLFQSFGLSGGCWHPAKVSFRLRPQGLKTWDFTVCSLRLERPKHLRLVNCGQFALQENNSWERAVAKPMKVRVSLLIVDERCKYDQLEGMGKNGSDHALQHISEGLPLFCWVFCGFHWVFSSQSEYDWNPFYVPLKFYFRNYVP